MDSFLDNDDDEIRSVETRWDRIEKRHINSAIVYDRSDAAQQICKDLIENKEFITGNHLKALLGEKPKRLCLDPNMVMDLRHTQLKRRNKSATFVSKGRTRSSIDERLHFQKMFALNREIDKFKKSLEKIRPKSSEPRNGRRVRECHSARSIRNSKFGTSTCEINEVECVSLCDSLANGFDLEKEKEEDDGNENDAKEGDKIENETNESDKNEDSGYEKREESEVDDNQTPRSFNTPPIPSEYLIDESYVMNGIDVNYFQEHHHIDSYSETGSPCSSIQTEYRTELRPMPQIQQPNDNFELIITPTIMVNIQDTIRSNLSHEFDCSKPNRPPKLPEFHRESKIAVNQHMSILIKKLSNEIVDEKSTRDAYMNESTEGNAIIKQVFDKQSQDNFILLQRYFLRWVHFNTIEKLKRRNPAQTRLQKMETFLQNITLERKRALNKLRRPNNLCTKRDDNKISVLGSCHMESPRLLIRTYNNKLKTQQDIIELQRIKLQRQQRIITEMKLSKLLEDTNEAENHLKEELDLVAKTGCPNSRSKAKCLQIAGNLKDKDSEVQSDLQAKGITAPKFLIEMQARALEREMRHQEAQRRREALDREKEALRIAAEEEKRLLDEQAKRDRIKEYWRKRRLEKELEAKKALERMRFLANMEIAKSFNRERLLKHAIEKFKNIVKWKIRNKKVSNELRRQILFRNTFQKWRNLTVRIWDERKSKADAFHNHHCKVIVWSKWQQYYLVTQSKKMVAEDWFHLKLSERVFRAWERVTAQARLVYELKQRQAEAHFNWYMKWKVLEHWRRLHAILKIEKETEARRERWRSKVYELIPDYTPNVEFI